MAGEKVLIVEDNAANMELATDLLDAAGYIVLQSENAEIGIETAKTEQPALILMDVGLPGMDGLTAVGILLQDEQTRDIPVVVVTAHAMKGDQEKAMQSGCAGYITKPIDTRAFSKTVAAYIEAAKSN
jgi:two-component system cell cycle response regulator DivK